MLLAQRDSHRVRRGDRQSSRGERLASCSAQRFTATAADTCQHIHRGKTTNVTLCPQHCDHQIPEYHQIPCSVCTSTNAIHPQRMGETAMHQGKTSTTNVSIHPQRKGPASVIQPLGDLIATDKASGKRTVIRHTRDDNSIEQNVERLQRTGIASASNPAMFYRQPHCLLAAFLPVPSSPLRGTTLPPLVLLTSC